MNIGLKLSSCRCVLGWRPSQQLHVSSAGRQVALCRPPPVTGRRPGRGPRPLRPAPLPPSLVSPDPGAGAAAGATGQSSFPCDMCGRVLGSIGSLWNHRSIHRGSTRCALCGNVYSTISALRRHVRSVHGVGGSGGGFGVASEGDAGGCVGSRGDEGGRGGGAGVGSSEAATEQFCCSWR